MSEQFPFDVFLSHSSRDKIVVRTVAERLRADGLNVWLDEWVLKPGDRIPAKIDEGLERSRVLVLCMSANAFGSDWTQLEADTFRFRDPLNHERRFIPLRLDGAPIKGSLAQLLYIDWCSSDREHEYAKLLEACRPLTKPTVVEGETTDRQVAEKAIQLDYKDARILAYSFSLDGKRALTGDFDETMRLWDLETGQCLRVFGGHLGAVGSVAWSPDNSYALSGATDGEMRLWNVQSGVCMRVFACRDSSIWSVAWTAKGRHALSGSGKKVTLWDIETGKHLRQFKGHTSFVKNLVWTADERRFVSGAEDQTIRLWDANTGRCLRVLEGHTGWAETLVWSKDEHRLLSGSEDGTIRLWDMNDGRCLRVLNGHKGWITDLILAAGESVVLSCSQDKTLRVWDVETGRCLRVFEGHEEAVKSVAWSADGRRAFSGDAGGGIRVWDLSEFATEPRPPQVTPPASPVAPDQIQYTNAKVLLVGESGAGKTGLSKRLAADVWEPSDSTVGAWATHWKLPVSSGQAIEREVWLWDFGGQADQRLIHQLYMDETALAVLVFDGQKEDLFETLGQWDRDLTRASRKEFVKLLVAGRIDAGGLRASRSEIDRFAAERKFRGFLETSAKTNHGCDDLKQAILDAIKWDEIPCRTTEVLFKRLKEEIVRLKDEGRVLMRFNELRETLQLRLSGEFKPFADEELRAVLTLLAGPGVVWELAFGSWVLLQPERINAYAQAVIRTLQADEHQRGYLMEERVLKGDLAYDSSLPRLARDEERFVLLAMHQTLVERGLCLRQPSDKGNLLVFPSYYRRERPDIVNYPTVLVIFRFTGFLDEIYATLVVRLHHTDAFQQDQLWRYAADFKTNTGKQLGVKLTRRSPGVGELEVYFDPAVAMEEKIIFSKYINDHLMQYARDVERLRHYACPQCGTPVGNRELAMKRLNAWLQGRPPQSGAVRGFKVRKDKEELPSIICAGCEQRVLLWDPMEQCFASPEIQRRVRDMQEESKIVLDNESKERALVGEVISTVALAGQICREFNVSDHGIDMEIEFKDDANEATGAKVYLQLKSGDSYLHKRKSTGEEVFTIRDERHARYWSAQAFPVLLIIRSSEGEIRWMEVREVIRRANGRGQRPVKKIVFKGERFDVMSVRRWRERALSSDAS